MNKEREIFEKLEWKEKVNYIVGFYQDMIKKSEKPEHIELFQSVVDTVSTYEESEEANAHLLDLFDRICRARDRSKEKHITDIQEQIEKNQEKLARVEANEETEDADLYLAEALAELIN